MVAVRVVLPWTMEQAVLPRKGILVKSMVPGRLTFAAQAASIARWGQRESIIIRNSVQIRGGKAMGNIQVPANTNTAIV